MATNEPRRSLTTLHAQQSSHHTCCKACRDLLGGTGQQHQLAQASHPSSSACMPSCRMLGNHKLFCEFLLETQIQRNIDEWQRQQAWWGAPARNQLAQASHPSSSACLPSCRMLGNHKLCFEIC
jgi:hypothetical protein